MGRDRQYTKSQRNEALDIWRVQGVSAAARHAGVSRQTIYNWIDDAGLSLADIDREAVYQHKRAQLRFNLMERIYFLLGQMKAPVQGAFHYQGNVTHYHIDLPSASDQANYARAIEALLNLIRMEEGEPISRVDLFDSNLIDKQLMELANELGDKAKGLEVKEIPSETDIIQKFRNETEVDDVEATEGFERKKLPRPNDDV